MKTFLLLFCFTPSSFAQWQSLDQAIQIEVEKHHLPALSPAIGDGETTIYRSHVGAANEKSVYRAASITKLFTAIAIMQLADAGKLDLDQPVTRYLPELNFINPFNTPCAGSSPTALASSANPAKVATSTKLRPHCAK